MVISMVKNHLSPPEPDTASFKENCQVLLLFQNKTLKTDKYRHFKFFKKTFCRKLIKKVFLLIFKKRNKITHFFDLRK